MKRLVDVEPRTIDEWLGELRRRIELSDSRYKFLWAAFATIFAGVWLLFVQALDLLTLGSGHVALWLVGLGCAFYLLLGTTLIQVFYNSNMPPWTAPTKGFDGELLHRFISQYGAPKAGRILAWHDAGLFLVFSGALWILAKETGGPTGVFGILLALNFLFSSFGRIAPLYLPRKFLAHKVEDGMNDVKLIVEKIDKPAELERRAALMLMVVKYAVKFSFLAQVVFLGLVLVLAPDGAWSTVRASPVATIALVASVFIGAASTRLLALLVVDQSRSLLEQLHHLTFVRRLAPEQVHRMLMVIESFRRAHYVLQKPIEHILEELDVESLDPSYLAPSRSHPKSTPQPVGP